MTVFLIHKNFDGEPQGIWAEDERHYYPQPESSMAWRGKGIIEERSHVVPWLAFATRMQERVSHQDWWEKYDSLKSLQEAFEDAYTKYHADQNSRHVTDK